MEDGSAREAPSQVKAPSSFRVHCPAAVVAGGRQGCCHWTAAAVRTPDANR